MSTYINDQFIVVPRRPPNHPGGELFTIASSRAPKLLVNREELEQLYDAIDQALSDR
ncbi:hypothetical protein [Nocardia flavorosea]|uniref:Uncharacterized protein n=1 Tax=Nocardia flavorosea TaxID=53429 RepID=A0A846YIB3_9NOCA|nr:hypothetical protein [Nocardia flavorosea]NKY57410.1 hypothetical protein [Nocardia flavorosea]